MQPINFDSPNIFKSSLEKLFSKINLSQSDLKIVLFICVFFTAIGKLITGCYGKKKEFTLPLNDSPTVLKVKQQVPLNLSFEESSNLNSSSEEVSIEFAQEEAQVTALIPTPPPLDFLSIFKELAIKTKSVECFPYTLNCRFGNVLCPKKTHVKALGDSKEIYLHANHVILEGIPFIAAQYPQPIHFPLFWRTCAEVCLTIDLTNEKDKGLRTYYPILKDSKNCAEVSLKCMKEEKVKQLESGTLYHYEMEDKIEDRPHYHLSRLHYQGWNDFQGITEDDLDQILFIMDQYKQDSLLPFLIHCRAGVGRTGTIIVAFVLRSLIKMKKVNAENLKEELCRLILEGRAQRGEFFVQSPEQFATLWKWSWRALHQKL